MSEDQSPTVTVRMDAELVRRARIVCAHTPGRGGKQLKLVDFLDSIVRSVINERYTEIMGPLPKPVAPETSEPTTRRRKRGKSEDN